MKEKLKNKLLGINEISDNKQKPIIFLLIWLIFIGAVVVLVRNNTNNVDNSNQNVVAFNSLETIFDRYKTYKYEISISDLDNNKILYKGDYKNGVNTGSRINGEETINYKIEDNIIINSDTNEIIENLYGNYLSVFFVPSNIYTYIRTISGTEKEDGNIKKYNYEYMYEDKNIYIEINTTKDLIDSISIAYDDIKYNIKFSE